MRKRILIVDDHPLYRQGLQQFLAEFFEVVGSACDGGEAIDKALALNPDVVLIDVNMAGMDGLAAARHIKQQRPTAAIVIMSHDDKAEQVMEAVEAGADGYVAKHNEPAQLLQALKAATNGQAYFPPNIAKHLLSRLSLLPHERTPSGIRLSPREEEVLHLLAHGLRNADLAKRLIISERTVANHITSIYNKLGVFSRGEAISYAIKHGLVRM